jgi:ketosteroid isomerase-like protein
LHGKQHLHERYCVGDAQENVDRFRAGVEAYNRADIERWLEDYHPDAVVEPQIAALEGGYSGLDDLRRLFADLADSWEVFEFHFPDVRVHDG